jgi:hypothetical protein
MSTPKVPPATAAIQNPDQAFRKQYDDATREMLEEGTAIVDEALKRAEARRRIHVDSQGRAIVTYEPLEVK